MSPKNIKLCFYSCFMKVSSVSCLPLFKADKQHFHTILLEYVGILPPFLTFSNLPPVNQYARNFFQTLVFVCQMLPFASPSRPKGCAFSSRSNNYNAHIVYSIWGPTVLDGPISL